MIRVKVEGKNIADLWRLACVKAITKGEYNSLIVKVACKKRAEEGMFEYKDAYVGDEIETESEQSPTGDIIPDLPF